MIYDIKEIQAFTPIQRTHIQTANSKIIDLNSAGTIKVLNLNLTKVLMIAKLSPLVSLRSFMSIPHIRLLPPRIYKCTSYVYLSN